jgi:multicomponent Na+:H+ antiporter subunit E
MRERVRNAARLTVWAYLVWLFLTWTATAEQLIFGLLLAIATGVVMAPLGDVVPPWRLLDPRRAWAICRLAGYGLAQIALANVRLAGRIWAPSRPLRSGMVIVATTARTDGELAASGLISSLIVDNQIVDLDRSEHVLQYHVVAVPRGDRAEAINAPVERRVAAVRRP